MRARRSSGSSTARQPTGGLSEQVFTQRAGSALSSDRMQPAEMRDGGALVGTTLGDLTELARDVHKAVAARVFGLLGPIAASGAGAARRDLGHRVRPGADSRCARCPPRRRRRRRADPASRASSLRRHPARPFRDQRAERVLGDRLAERARPSLAPVLSLRTHDGRLRRMPGNVAHDVDDTTTGRLVRLPARTVRERALLVVRRGAALGRPGRRRTVRCCAHERGWTPLYVHYNTGLQVSENGRLLAGYLETLVDRWPVPVTEIALVGHSMGGLVARSAAHRAAEHGLVWVGRVAPRRRARHPAPRRAARTVGQRPHARDGPAAGDPSVRHLAQPAQRRDQGHAARLGGRGRLDRRSTPMTRPTAARRRRCCPGVAYSMVSATLSQRPDGTFAHDLLVEHISAHGTGRPNATRRIEFEVDRLFHVGRAHALPPARRSRRCTRQLRSWLDGADGADRATAHITETTG